VLHHRLAHLPSPHLAAYKEGAAKMGEGIARIGIISLISAADTAKPLAPPGLGLRREPSGVLAGAGAAAAAATDPLQPRSKSGLTAAALELAAAPYAAPLTAVAAGNQKLLLLAAFLQARWQALVGRGEADSTVPRNSQPCFALPSSHLPCSAPPLFPAAPQIGDWAHAQALMRWLRALGLSDFAIFPPVGEALCE
jgi:hypothetical protein